MSISPRRLPTAVASGAQSGGRSRGRPSSRTVLLLSLGLILVCVSWWLRSSPWAHENQLRLMDLPQLEETVGRQPEDSLARYYLAKRYYLERRFLDAEGAYSEAVRLEPGSARAHLGLGLTRMELGRSDQARSELETALQYDPSLAWAEYMIGKIEWQRGDVNAALPHAKRATELDPRSHPAWYSLSVCYIQLHRFDEGVGALRQALAREGRNARYHTALGELLVYRGQTDEGRQHYEKALAIEPEFGPACALMGGFFLRKVPGIDSVDRAQELLERATRLKTYHPNQVYFDLGELYLQKGLYLKSVDALNMSIRLDSRDERPYFSLVKAYRRLGNNSSAKVAEEKFQTISRNHVQMQTMEARVFHNPNNAEARLQLARLYRDLGMEQQAAKQYSAFLSMSPGEPKVSNEFQQMLSHRTPTKSLAEKPDFILPPIN